MSCILKAGPSGQKVVGMAAVDRYGRHIDWSVDEFGRVRVGSLSTIFDTKRQPHHDSSWDSLAGNLSPLERRFRNM